MLDITELCYSYAANAAPQGQGTAVKMEAAASDPFFVPFDMTGFNPRIVWQVTQTCNLDCRKCPSNSRPHTYTSELTSREALGLIDDLAEFGVRQLLFGGGEPLMRPDLLELVAYARKRGIQPLLLTNGTLLSPRNVADLKRAGMFSISILLEGLGGKVDRQRGVRGTLEAAVEGYWHCQAAGLAVGFHIPLNRWTYPEIDRIFDWGESLSVRRLVFSHLVYAGRGNNPEDDLSQEEKRRALDLILARAEGFARRGVGIRIGTSENYVDGVYLYLQIARKNPDRAATILDLLMTRGSGVYGAGVGLASIDSTGNVHPDPYWVNCNLGNIRETRFSEIWTKSSDPLLLGLRYRLPLLKGRCAHCSWQQACGGSLRVRAEEMYGDPWMHDPACYLTAEEIIKELPEQARKMANDVLLEELAA
jgi:Fe-coproporphyrin III synthase